MADGYVAQGVVSFLNKSVEAISPTTAPSGISSPKEFDIGEFSGTFLDTVESTIPLFDFTSHNSSGLGEFFFERVWTFPDRIELGNIVSTVIRSIEVYNSWRDQGRTLSVAVANAGNGVSLLGVPTLPVDINPQDGLVINVQILTSGPPDINGTIDFTLDTGAQSVVLIGTRVVMFPYQPESGITEVLEFLTSVMTAVDGTEQRIQLRKNPRQKVSMRIRTVIDSDRRRLQHLLFSFHAGVFGLPIWWESRRLTSDASISDTTIQVNSSYGDFRVGGLLIVWSSPTVFDSVEITTVNPTNIVLSSPLTFDFVASQTSVMPLRVAHLPNQIGHTKWRVGLEEFQLDFSVIDNDSNLGDSSPFSSHNSKVMVDDPNVMRALTIPDDLSRQIAITDNRTAQPVQSSDWLNSVYTTVKGFRAESSQQIWQARQLLHALRGSQLSFYMPTFFEDLVAVGQLNSGQFTMDIEHVDYETYVNGNEPNKSIWIELNDGTVITNDVSSVTEVSVTVERLTMSSVWATTVLVSDIKRISFLRLNRVADDRIVFNHVRSGEAEISMNVRGVLQ